jgi:hypothetical protein
MKKTKNLKGFRILRKIIKINPIIIIKILKFHCRINNKFIIPIIFIKIKFLSIKIKMTFKIRIIITLIKTYKTLTPKTLIHIQANQIQT